jgi:hypothetical protein
MAKDAKGHGSEKRGGGPAAEPRRPPGYFARAMPTRTALDVQARRAGKNYIDPFDPRYPDSAARIAESRSEPQVQANLANTNARGALAQGHPKSAPVDVHPSMEQQMESHPAHSRVGSGDYSPARAVAAQHGIPTSHLDAMKEAIEGK